MFDATALQQTLAIARDAALILLALEGLLVGAAALLLIRATARGLRSLVPQFKLFMHKAQRTSSQVRGVIERAMLLLCMPFIWLNRASVQLTALARRLHALFGSAQPKGR
jgi:hypothetical protein